MSIQGLVGLPGHGKSYSALDLFITSAIQQNRKIVTNIPLNIEALKAVYQNYDFENNLISVDLEQAKKASAEWWDDQNQWPLSGLYILDELWRIWPAGMKASAVPTHQLAFIKEHRHRIDDSGIEPDIVFVTQNLGDIAACVRDMVETTIICTKLTSIGAKNNFRRDYYQGAVKGLVGPKMAFIRSDQCKYKPEIYTLYQSHTKSTGGHAAIKNDGVVNATIFNGWGFKLGVGFLVLMIVVVVYSFRKTAQGVEQLTAKTKPPEAKEIPRPVPPANMQPVQVAAAVPPAVSLSSTWRLSGVAHVGPNLDIALITDGSRTIRIDYKKYCKLDIDVVCEFRGETIARYTGSSVGSSSGAGEKIMESL